MLCISIREASVSVCSHLPSGGDVCLLVDSASPAWFKHLLWAAEILPQELLCNIFIPPQEFKPSSVLDFICSIAQSSCTVSRGPGLVYFRTYSNLNQLLTLCNSYLWWRDCYLKFCLLFKLYVALMACWLGDKYDLMQRNLWENGFAKWFGVCFGRHKGSVFVFNSNNWS